jgi:hypothetical protein
MRKSTLAGLLALAAAGCATGDKSPESQCIYFARIEGLEWLSTVKSAQTGGATAVTMEVKDQLARRFNATCVYADGKTRWAEPLPGNVSRDYPGRSFPSQ